MANDDYEVRVALLETLMEKVAADRYPSTTMLDMIEDMLMPDDLPVYAELLLTKIREENFPSIPMLARLKKFA